MARAAEPQHNSLWNEPVPRRVHAIAELGKQAFGQAITEARVRVDTQVIQMTVTIRGGAKAKVSKKTYARFKTMAQEALDVDVLCVYPKHANVHIKLSGTPQRAANAEWTANKRKRRREFLEWTFYACVFWAIGETAIAWRRAARGGSALGAYLSVLFWPFLVSAWASHHYLAQWFPPGSVFRQ